MLVASCVWPGASSAIQGTTSLHGHVWWQNDCLPGEAFTVYTWGVYAACFVLSVCKDEFSVLLSNHCQVLEDFITTRGLHCKQQPFLLHLKKKKKRKRKVVVS